MNDVCRLVYSVAQARPALPGRQKPRLRGSTTHVFAPPRGPDETGRVRVRRRLMCAQCAEGWQTLAESFSFTLLGLRPPDRLGV